MHRSRPETLPWIVAETVALKLLQVRPASLAIADDAGDRLRRTVGGLTRDPQLRWEIHAGEAVPSEPVECLVWVGDGEAPTQVARRRVLDLAAGCTGVVLLAEPLAPGVGVGRPVLRAMDPDLVELRTDELPDGLGGTRERRPWEAPRSWAVASVAAWRFEDDAEAARDGFLTRLPRLHGAKVVVACRRLLQHWPHAHEVFVLAARRVADLNDASGAGALITEVQLTANVPSHIERALRRALGPDLWPDQRSAAVGAAAPSNFPDWPDQTG